MRIYHTLSHCLIATAVLSLVACAPKPLYKTAPNLTQATPAAVSSTPESYAQVSVIWGGRIVALTNFADHTEVQLLAYPLDSSQRPQVKEGRAEGRFIAIVPGYLEPLNYPPGDLMTFSGHLKGVRSSKVGQADYVFPLVAADQYHLWTAEELRSPWSNVHLGVGVGVGVH